MLRRSPLSRGSKPLQARTPLVRRAPLASRVAAIRGRRPRSTGPCRDTVEVVLERASHLCERCNGGFGPVRGVDWHLHHRRPRAIGGSKRADTNSPSNLVLVCPSCHSEIESHRATAQAEGWLVPQGIDPAWVPILIDRGARWAYLTPGGRYSEHPPPLAHSSAGEEVTP